MFPIGLGMVELRSAFANDMPNLRAAGFPPLPGALHSSSAMGHHSDSSAAASTSGAGSFFPHHLRHHANLISSHNHQSGDSGPFGILPHESVNLMNSSSGSTKHSHSHPYPHASGPQNNNSGTSNKSCYLESKKYHHHHHHHQSNTNNSSSFDGMMQAMSQNVYSGAAAAAAAARNQFDHQFTKQLAHHQTPDPYFNNFLMTTDNYAASQYVAAAAAANMRVASNQHMIGLSNSTNVHSKSSHPQYSMNFSNSFARDFMNFGNNSSFKHGPANSCPNSTRGNVNSYINNYYQNPNIPNPSMIGSNYNHQSVCPSSISSMTTNHCNTSCSSSVANNYPLHHGSESSCSYSSPSTIPHSPHQKNSSVSSVISSQNSTSNATVSSGTQDYVGNSFTNSAYSTLGTPAGLSTSAYPTPPSSVNQQLQTQSGGTQDDSMRHFHVNSKNGSYSTNFNSFPSQKVSSGNIPASNSSCMVAAAAAAANPNVSNLPVNYLQHALTPTSGDGESCLPNLSSLTPTISDAISGGNKMNSVNNNIDPVLNNEHSLNSVFNGSEIEFPGLNFPMAEASAAANYAQQMRIDSTGPKKKKERSKKHKKKEKNKNIDRISISNNADPNLNNLSLFPYQNNSHYHESYSYNQSHHQSPAHPPTPVQQQSSLFAKSSTPYPEQSPTINQQMVIPQTQTSSISQTCNSIVSTSLSEVQSPHIQSQPNLLPQPEMLPRTPSACFDSSLNNLQSDLLNDTLGDHSDTGTASMATIESENHIDKEILSKYPSLEDELNFLTAADESEQNSKAERNEIVKQVGSQRTSSDESPIIPSQQAQIPNSSVSEMTQPTLSSVSSCMVQSESVPIINVSRMVDRNLTSPCAISDDSRAIKSVSNLKEYQSDFIFNNQQRFTPPMTSNGGGEVNNVENVMKIDSDLVKKKKKSKELKSKLFCQQANSMINIVPIHADNLNAITTHTNKAKMSHITTCKPVEVANLKKSIDLKDHEAKFFKMRPNTNSTTITTLDNVQDSVIKTNLKGTKKRKLEDPKQKSALDEYEFPDSPTYSSTKKVKKINLENSRKKVSEKLVNNNSCSITINKKVSAKPKIKLNQSFNSNTVGLNVSEKTEIFNINIVDPKIEDKVVKIAGSVDKKHFNVNITNNESFHQSKKNQKDSSKLPSIIVQEILPSSNSALPSISQPSSKKITNTINIVSICKKLKTGSNQSKKDSPVKSCGINDPAINTLTTIVPIPTNTSIIMDNQPNTTAKNQQPPSQLRQKQQQFQPQPQQQNQSSLKSLINQNVLMQSTATNTPRRRSQDKKALTIREGLMRTGDFVVALDETASELPMIWRIEGKSLLQRFEPNEQDGQIVYINTSSYSAWNPTVKQRYTGVDVRIVGCNRTKIVIEKLGLTKNNNSYEKLSVENYADSIGDPSINGGKIKVEKLTTPDEKSSHNYQHQADFEVFIQTLISQALDANFISEIIKENDEYFLSHIQAIDNYCMKKKSRFFTKVKWDAHIVKCVETFLSFAVIPQSQVGDLRCRLCHDNWSTQILHFTGKTYDQVTLETLEPVDIKQTKYAACDECKEKVSLFSNLHHQKFNFFTKCREKVEEMKGGVEDKDSPMILEECLKDTEWIQSLFKQFEEIWQLCDRIR